MAMLEINNVSQSFRTGFWLKNVEILHQVNLSVPERSVFGFLGPNGAGKTTLIQLIVGMRQPTSGTLTLCGNHASSREARRHVGYLPERPYFHEHLTGEGLLQYMGALSGISKKHIFDRIPKVLSSVGMTHARHVELKKYSKGMLQRIGIAQAILHDPQFLVLDEPMSGLDPLGRKEMRELICSLSAEGRTLFFSSHVIPDVEAICDHVALIQKGRIVGCGLIGSFLAKGPIQTEIGFSGVSGETVKHWRELRSIREMPEGIRAVVDSQTGVNQVLKKVIDSGGQVLWVTPVRASLEELFGPEYAGEVKPGV